MKKENNSKHKKTHIKQHYVPQFYLKNFAKEHKNRSKKSFYIHCFDKNNHKKYPSNIKSIAQKTYFYDTKDNTIEEWLGNIEYKSSKILNELIKYKKYKLLNNQDKRAQISIFLAIQSLRTVETRETISDMYKELEKKSKEIPGVKLSEQLQKKFDSLQEDKTLQLLHNDSMNLIYNISPHIFFKKWCFLKNKTKLNFWTSDNPVVKHNSKGGNIGLISEYMELHFPLTPKLSLVLLDPKHYSGFNQEINLSNLDNIINNTLKADESMIKDKEKINFFNDLQAKHSTRHVFSKYDDLSRIEKLIERGEVKNSSNKKRLNITSMKYKDNKNKTHDIFYTKIF